MDSSHYLVWYIKLGMVHWTLSVSNNFDPDQDRHFVSPNLEVNAIKERVNKV